MAERLRVSVRTLVEHSLRSGDLDLESSKRASPLDAIRAHQKLQGERGEGYRKEVPVSRVVATEDLGLEVQGRIDGIWEREEGLLVEEIKTTRGDLEGLAEAREPLHWGQLEVYAFLVAEERGLAAVDARLTYYHLDTGRSLELDRRFTSAELRARFDRLVERYLDWARTLRAWRRRRDASIERLDFPHASYRAGQRELAVEVFRAIRDGERLLAQAPTGVGKTIASLFPSLKALGSGTLARIFYLTARTTGRGLAEGTLDALRRRGLLLRALTLTAKEKICFNPEKACVAEECTFARGFYDRLEGAMAAARRGNGAWTRARVEEIALEHHLCPFELGLELGLEADAVIADYNHVFDPRVYLRRFFDDGPDAPFVLLVDEAHNLVDRARDMFSAELRKTSFLALRRAIDRSRHPGLARSLAAVNRELLALRRRAETFGGRFTEDGPPAGLAEALARFTRASEVFLAEATVPRETRALARERYFEAVWFLKLVEEWSEIYVACHEAQGPELRSKLFCTDPAPRLAERLAAAKAAIFFSATLTPPGYFARLFGAGETAKKLSFPSPFPRGHLEVLVARHLATTYRRRRETEAELTDLLVEFVSERPGNYLLYFPSYAYLTAILERFTRVCDGVAVAVQSPAMTEPEREAFLARFAQAGRPVTGFAVLGGFFGEGIDLPGEKLMGAAIVGVGLPGISPERDRIRVHFDRAGADGFDYAYAFPGMNRVLQAAGRVIRSEGDRGAVLLVDERFGERRYLRLLPPEWEPTSVSSGAELREALRAFWSHRAEARA